MSDLLERDMLNEPFEAAKTLDDVVRIYLHHADRFHLDPMSGGDRERAEQFIKFLIALVLPKED